MSTDPKLEDYLNKLDKSLGQIPVSERADIITEIKSHVLEAKERDPSQSTSAILASLGEPETVANRFLLERGLKVSKPPKTPMVKWLTIGFLGTLSIFALLIIVILWRFTPIISVDEEEDRVIILGGLIDVNGRSWNNGRGSKHADRGGPSGNSYEGSKEIGKSVQQVLISFKNGIITVSSNDSHFLTWKCIGHQTNAPRAVEKKEQVELNIQQADGIVCEVSLPSKTKAYLKGEGGQVGISKPKSDLSVRMENGQVRFIPDGNLKYKYEVRVQNGYADKFESSNEKGALNIDIELANGYIKRD